jgi:tRNA dimethylallyltransferase
MSKLVAVLGPTASGKTSLSVKLAYKYKTEIISADSRQIYRGMDIGTGKDLDEYNINKVSIPYHLIDILNPSENYSVYDYKNDFLEVYNTINKKNKVPILSGGTGLYIESILLNYQMNDTPPDIPLRNKLQNKSLEQLQNEMKSNFNNSYDASYHTTKRRIIRTMEILLTNNQNVNHLVDTGHIEYIVFGIDVDREKLLKKIKSRLEARLNDGMIDEVRHLIDRGLTLDRLRYFGLEYKFIGEYLFNKISYDSMKEKLNFGINKFSKRQMTFFRRMQKRGINIKWVNADDFSLICEHIEKFFENEF